MKDHFQTANKKLTHTDPVTKVTVCPIVLQEGDVQRPEEKTREHHDNFFQDGLPWRQHFKLE